MVNIFCKLIGHNYQWAKLTAPSRVSTMLSECKRCHVGLYWDAVSKIWLEVGKDGRIK